VIIGSSIGRTEYFTVNLDLSRVLAKKDIVEFTMSDKTKATQKEINENVIKVLSWKIDKVDSLGSVSVKFSQQMRDEADGFNLSHIDNTVFKF
jgi:hypothetical protein